MRKPNFLTLALLAIGVLTLASCKKEKPQGPDYGPANTVTVDGTTLPVTAAWGWGDSSISDGESDVDALSLSFATETHPAYISFDLLKTRLGSNFNFPSSQYWVVAMYKWPNAGGDNIWEYDVRSESNPAGITKGHVYAQRTGDGGEDDYGSYILRFDVTFSDGRRAYGNYTGNFVWD